MFWAYSICNITFSVFLWIFSLFIDFNDRVAFIKAATTIFNVPTASLSFWQLSHKCRTQNSHNNPLCNRHRSPVTNLDCFYCWKHHELRERYGGKSYIWFVEQVKSQQRKLLKGNCAQKRGSDGSDNSQWNVHPKNLASSKSEKVTVMWKHFRARIKENMYLNDIDCTNLVDPGAAGYWIHDEHK